MATTASSGRPRRAGVEDAVITATAELVASRGFAGTSLDEIAVRARVAKTTVYRRWPSKAALCVDALVQLLGEPPAVAVQHENGLRAAVSWLAERVRLPAVDALLVGLVAEAARDEDLRARLRARIREPFTSKLARDWQLPDDDVNLAFDIVVGALLHRRGMNGLITDHDASIISAVATDLIAASRPASGRAATRAGVPSAGLSRQAAACRCGGESGVTRMLAQG